jgi:hypothetical protein
MFKTKKETMKSLFISLFSGSYFTADVVSTLVESALTATVASVTTEATLQVSEQFSPSHFSAPPPQDVKVIVATNNTIAIFFIIFDFFIIYIY